MVTHDQRHSEYSQKSNNDQNRPHIQCMLKFVLQHIVFPLIFVCLLVCVCVFLPESLSTAQVFGHIKTPLGMGGRLGQ